MIENQGLASASLELTLVIEAYLDGVHTILTTFTICTIYYSAIGDVVSFSFNVQGQEYIQKQGGSLP